MSSANRLLIKHGRVVDPGTDTDIIKDIKVEDGVIVKEFTRETDVKSIEAKGMIVAPGLIDMHVHLRDPGREDEETVISGAVAAAAGGFTTIVCMPNTAPPVDRRSIHDYIVDKAAGAPADVKVVGAISAGLAGECLSDMGDLADAGAVGFSDDGCSVMDSALMRRALEYSRVFNLPIISHAEDVSLSNNGIMHEGLTATRLGLKGIPAAAEEIMVARDIVLAEMTGARLHITHVSTAGSVTMIKAAKKRGLNITADVTPHHLVLTDEKLKGYDTNYKINPPLRTKADNKALIGGLLDGTIDAIASDHAPHAAHEKEREMETAPFGVIGLQTTLPVILTHLITMKLTLSLLIGKLTIGPAKILGLNKGTLALGSAGDITIIDPKAKVKVEVDCFLSKSQNSAFVGSELVGQAKYVIIGGRVVLGEGKLLG